MVSETGKKQSVDCCTQNLPKQIVNIIWQECQKIKQTYETSLVGSRKRFSTVAYEDVKDTVGLLKWLQVLITVSVRQQTAPHLYPSLDIMDFGYNRVNRPFTVVARRPLS